MLIMLLKRVFSSFVTWLVILFTLIIFIAGDYIDYAVGASLTSIFSFTTTFGVGQVIASIIFPLPFLLHYSEDIIKGNDYFQLIRYSKKKYLLIQISAAIISISIMVIITCILFSIISIILGASISFSDTEIYEYKDSLLNVFLTGNIFPLYIIYIFSYILYLLPGLMFAIMTSSFIKNKYIIIAMPYISFSLVQFLADLFNCYDIDWNLAYICARVPSKTPLDLFYCFAYPIFLTIIAALIYYINEMRGFNNGKR